MPKPLHGMTMEELKREYAYWDLKVRSAAQWGSTMERAEKELEKYRAEIEKRHVEARRPR